MTQQQLLGMERQLCRETEKFNLILLNVKLEEGVTFDSHLALHKKKGEGVRQHKEKQSTGMKRNSLVNII
jgi:hypothetical protein